MNIAEAILSIFPNANPVTDFSVQDDSDGNGSYIAQWNEETIGAPQPTEEELQTAWNNLQPSEASLLADAQNNKKGELSRAIQWKIVSGLNYNVPIASTGQTYRYGTTAEDQQNMTATRVWSDNNQDQIVKYRPTGGVGRIDHTREEFVAISNIVFNRTNWYLDQADKYIPMIYGPDATVDSINAIVIEIEDPVDGG